MPTPGERFDRASGTVPYKPQTRALDPLDIVIADGWNVRDMTSPETQEHIASLKLSILTNGYDLTKPIAVRYDRVSGISTLVDGQCRLTACRQLRQEGHELYVPCVCTEGDEASLTVSSIAGNAGKPLTQWEIGEGCRRLMRFGWSKEKIAASICKSVRYVTDAIALSNVPVEAKAMMAAGEATPGAVLSTVREHGDAAPKVLREKLETAKVQGRDKIKREKATPATEVSLENMVRNVLISVTIEELREENGFVSVDRQAIIALWNRMYPQSMV